MARKPPLKFSYETKQNIWKIHAFPESKYLILELRDQETLQVTFDILTLAGEVVVQQIRFEEDWWISVEQIINNEAIFYTFDSAGNPEVKSLIAFDISKSKTKWTKEPFDLAAYLNENGGDKNINVSNPFHYSQGSEYFKTVENFIKQFLNVHITRGVDYMEYKSNVLISYFIESEEKLVNKLLVINENKEVLLHEELGIFDNGISDNNFFIINNTLIFVKAFREFFMYDI